MDLALMDVAGFALVVSLSPFPIIALLPILASSRARAAAPMFLIGWAIGTFVAVGAAVALLELSRLDPSADSDPAPWLIGLRLVLAVALLGFALSQWLSRPSAGEVPASPAWLASLTDATPRRAATVGVLLSAANPKVLMMGLGAAASIVEAELAPSTMVAACGLFMVIALLGPMVPVAIALTMGERADALLRRLSSWLEQHNAAIMATVFALIGLRVLVDVLRDL